MSQLLKGAPVVDMLAERTRNIVAGLAAAPTLAILRVGEKDSDLSYERGATKRCSALGIEVRNVVLPEDVSQADLAAAVTALNEDDSVSGVLMFRPLPRHINEAEICEMLDPRKDVDGITLSSMAGVFCNKPVGFTPCTAQAVMEMIDCYNIPLSGRNVCVLGRSEVVGRPAAMLLMHRGATVTICHSKTVNAPEICSKADIAVVAIGRTDSLGPEYFSENETVIDVGIGWSDSKQKLCGDVKFNEVDGKVAAITPVPGGLGAVTSAVLALHVAQAAQRMAK